MHVGIKATLVPFLVPSSAERARSGFTGESCLTNLQYWSLLASFCHLVLNDVAEEFKLFSAKSQSEGRHH